MRRFLRRRPQLHASTFEAAPKRSSFSPVDSVAANGRMNSKRTNRESYQHQSSHEVWLSRNCERRRRKGAFQLPRGHGRHWRHSRVAVIMLSRCKRPLATFKRSPLGGQRRSIAFSSAIVVDDDAFSGYKTVPARVFRLKCRSTTRMYVYL